VLYYIKIRFTPGFFNVSAPNMFAPPSASFAEALRTFSRTKPKVRHLVNI
jgi:hypothetical protein